MTSSSKQRIVVAVDGGIHKTDKGMTGGVGMITFRLRPVAPESKRVIVESISVRGRYFDASTKVTNNIMELQGFCIMAHELNDEIYTAQQGGVDPDIGSIEFWSDSQYALGILFDPEWKAKANKSLVKVTKTELGEINDVVPVSGKFIRGHKGHFINEFADLVAALSIRRKKDIRHELSYQDIEECCLFCDNFPCQAVPSRLGVELIPTWKERFNAIQSTAYGAPCANRKAYDAERVYGSEIECSAAAEGTGARS